MLMRLAPLSLRVRHAGRLRPGLWLAGVALLLSWCGGVPASRAASLDMRVQAELARQVQGGAQQLVLGRERLALHSELGRFYRERQFRPAWITEEGPSPQAEALLHILRAAEQEGLCPEDYHLSLLESLHALAEDARSLELVFDPVWMSHFELLLSDAFLHYASHLLQGRFGGPSDRHQWHVFPREADLVKLLGYALDSGRLEPILETLLPPHPGYQRLRELLARYRALLARGGWPPIPPGASVRPGEQDPRLPLIKTRLFLEGDLTLDPAENSPVLDPATVAALRLFQTRHGLSADGVFGPATRAAMNVPVEARIRQIEVNLERWRWLPKSFGRRHLLINIADFSLALREDEERILSMRAVVGSGYRQTPVFSSRLTYLEFAPTWTVPPTILRQDLLPRLKRNPELLTRQHFEIVRPGNPELVIDPATIDWRTVEPETFPGVLRQKPGPWNPLGRVKFMFPNRFDIYLHDTPDRSLFTREVRTFSSGCIRIERPLELARALLETPDGAADPLPELLAASAPQRVFLREGIPVHLQYWTAWVEPDGAVHFREDIYLRDLDLEFALMERSAARP